MTALCTHPDTDATPRKVRVPAPPDAELDRLVLAAPPMTGAEYLTAEVLDALWQELDAAFGIELAESKCGVQDFLKRRNPAWNLVGRVHFNLAENRKDPDAPFAFLATYTTRLSAQAKAQHLPLGTGAAASTRARRTRTVCCRCSFPCSARRRPARG